MSEFTYRANLSAKVFPLLTELHGRTVIVKGQDHNYVAPMVPKEEADKDVGVPQIYYAHNVLPSTYGYQSVGYTQFIASTLANFAEAKNIYDGSGKSALLGITSTGLLYSLEYGEISWRPITAPVGSAGKQITTAYVSGITYIYFEGIACYKYNFTTHDIELVTLAGLTLSEIIGIVGSSGYMLAYSKDAVAWSSTIDPTDFIPSLATGAGGGALENARGFIVTAVPIYGGLLFFTTKNAVSAQYSNNERFPFNFNEVVGAGGLSSYNYASFDTNASAIYAYTTYGMQTVSARSAAIVYPDVTDFISGSRFEDFNETTNEFVSRIVNNAIKKKLVIVAGRYLVLSYGDSALTHALVIDLALRQFGKLKISHTDCFEFQLYDQTLYETPKKSIAFLLDDGSIKLLNTDQHSSESNGVILLGKYQYVRARQLTLQGVELESVKDSASLEVLDLPCLDGKTFSSAISGFLHKTSSLARTYLFHNTAVNHSVLIKGNFSLVSLVLKFTIHGKR